MALTINKTTLSSFGATTASISHDNTGGPELYLIVSHKGTISLAQYNSVNFSIVETVNESDITTTFYKIIGAASGSNTYVNQTTTSVNTGNIVFNYPGSSGIIQSATATHANATTRSATMTGTLATSKVICAFAANGGQPHTETTGAIELATHNTKEWVVFEHDGGGSVTFTWTGADNRSSQTIIMEIGEVSVDGLPPSRRANVMFSTTGIWDRLNGIFQPKNLGLALPEGVMI